MRVSGENATERKNTRGRALGAEWNGRYNNVQISKSKLRYY